MLLDEKLRRTEDFKVIKNVIQEFERIEKKNRCLRVRFLDWLSDTLLNWSNRIHVVSNNIDNPCILEVAPRKREDSKHAEESKRIVQLRERIAEMNEINLALRRENDEIAGNLIKEVEELQKELKK